MESGLYSKPSPLVSEASVQETMSIAIDLVNLIAPSTYVQVNLSYKTDLKGCAVTSDTRGPRFESSHRQKKLCRICLLLTVKKTKNYHN